MDWVVGEFVYEADGFQAYGDYLAYEADYVFGVFFAVGVVDYAAAFVGGDLVLVDDPFEGAAVVFGFPPGAWEVEGVD